MEGMDWIQSVIGYVQENPIITAVVLPAVAGLVTTFFMSHSRTPRKISQGGGYFETPSLLTPPMARPAYSDRMAYVLAEMSGLAYFEFEGSSGALQQAVDNFLELNPDEKNGIEGRVRDLLTDFRDNLLIKTVDSREFLRRILERSGFDLIDTINIKSTQAFVCKRSAEGEPPYLVVAFRGTEMEIDDWLTDADARPTVDEATGSMVHTGFLEALTKKKDGTGNTVLQAVSDILDSPPAMGAQGRLPCFITGHSLGGALALITMCEIASDINGACYTYGAPRVANYEYFENMKSPVFRLVNSADIVPRVPPGAIMGILLKLVQGLEWLTRFIPGASKPLQWIEQKVDMLNGYRHHGDLRYLTDVKTGRFADVQLLSNPPMIDRVWWMWQHIRKSFFSPVQSHGMAIYRKKLQQIATRRNAAHAG